MRQKLIRTAQAIFAILSLWSQQTQAIVLSESVMDGTSSFVSQTLANSCFALDVPADTLPCNPAFIGRKRASQARAQIFLGNNVTYLKDANELINGHPDSSTVQRLFSQRSSSEFQLALAGGYYQEGFGFELTPFHLNFETLFSDQALPQITLFASIEESARVQFGHPLGDDFYWGLQVRYRHRRYVSSEFFVTDVLTEDGSSRFSPQDQDSVFLEPSLLYAPEDVFWRPSLSAGVRDLGVSSGSGPATPINLQYHLSGAIAPEFKIGELSLGLDLMWNQAQRDVGNFATLGASYRYGILRLLASASSGGQGVGFIAEDDFWSIGLNYVVRQIVDSVGASSSERKIYFILGVVL